MTKYAIEGLSLRIAVISAQNLKAADKTGFSDPYAVLRIGSKKYETCVVKQNLNPVWNKEFNIMINPQKMPTHLSITVWDKDSLGRDFLGEVNIPVKNIFDRNAGGAADGLPRHYGDPENQPAWFDLDKKKESQFVSGAIQLKFGFVESHMRSAEEYLAFWESVMRS